MHLLCLPLLLPLAVLSPPQVWAKNWGPRVPGSVRQVPSPRDTRDSLVTIPTSHVLYENYDKDVVWLEESQWRALFRLPEVDDIPVKSPLVSRVLKPSTGIAPDSCMGCSGNAKGQIADVSWITIDYFQSVMLKKGANLLSNCLFYSALYVPEDLARYLTKYQPFPPFVDPALSELATFYACNNQLNTIWMLWPGKSPTGENPQQTTDTSTYNYFEMFIDGSWLQPIRDKTQVRQYFVNMSTAMAKSCGGIIRVLSEAPTNLAKYDGTIWKEHELPALQDRLETGFLAPTKLISIDANNMALQYELSWTSTNVVKRQLTEDDEDYWWGWNETIKSRTSCDANVAYEAASGMDWFG